MPVFEVLAAAVALKLPAMVIVPVTLSVVLLVAAIPAMVFTVPTIKSALLLAVKEATPVAAIVVRVLEVLVKL